VKSVKEFTNLAETAMNDARKAFVYQIRVRCYSTRRSGRGGINMVFVLIVGKSVL
jgi:hypothetical protein